MPDTYDAASTSQDCSRSLQSLNPSMTMAWIILVVGWMVVSFTCIFFLRHASKAQRKYLSGQEWVYLNICPPQVNTQSTLAVTQIFAQLHSTASSPSWIEKYIHGKIALWYSFEIVSLGGRVSFLVRLPKAKRQLVEAALYAQYPECEIKQVGDFLGLTTFQDTSPFDIWATELKLTEPDALAIRTYREFEHMAADEKIIDPLKPLFEALSSVGPQELYAIQILARPLPDEAWKPEVEKYVTSLIGQSPNTPENQKAFTGLPDVEKERINNVLKKASHPGFAVKLRHLYLAPKEHFDHNLRALIHSAYQVFGNPYANQFKAVDKLAALSANPFAAVWPASLLTAWRIRRCKLRLFQGFKERSLEIGAEPIILTTPELATIYHLPLTSETTAPSVNLSSLSTRTRLPPPNLPISKAP